MRLNLAELLPPCLLCIMRRSLLTLNSKRISGCTTIFCECFRFDVPFQHIWSNCVSILHVIGSFLYSYEKVNGFAIEMGAIDGISASNTYFFSKAASWKSLLIEANPGQHA